MATLIDIITSSFFSNGAIELFAKNWTQDAEGTQRRMVNTGTAIRAMGENLNALLGAVPRTNFSKCQSLATADNWGQDPLYFYRLYDGIFDAQEYVVTIVYVPRITASGYTGNCYAWGYGTHGSTNGFENCNDIVDAVSKYSDVRCSSYVVSRGNRALADLIEGVSTFEGFTVLAISFQDKLFEQFDNTFISYHCADTSEAKAGEKILADIGEDIRSYLHALRQYALPPVFSWCAMGLTRAAAVAPGDDFGIVVTSETYVNVFDQSVTTRTTTSPGQTCSRYLAAVGQNVSTKCVCRVYAKCTGAEFGGTIKFIGPDHVADNYVELTVPDSSDPVWITESVGILLNALSPSDDVASSANKIDVQAKVTPGGTMQIFYLTSFEEYTA